jgi:hypothetical protein
MSVEQLFGLSQQYRQAGNYAQAIALLRRVCADAPDQILYQEHLGTALLFSNSGANIAEAFTCFLNVLQQQPHHYTSAVYVMMLGLRSNRTAEIIEALRLIVTEATLTDEQALMLHAGYSVALYLAGDTTAAATHAHKAVELRAIAYDTEDNPRAGDLPYMFIFARFVAVLLQYQKTHPALYHPTPSAPLHVIGESHCLTPAHLQIGEYHIVPHMIMGAKAYYFTTPACEFWQYALQQIVQAIPEHEPVVFCFGEIDCRIYDGIMEQCEKNPAYDLAHALANLTASYVAFVANLMQGRSGSAWIMGVPAPNPNAREIRNADAAKRERFVQMIGQFNAALSQALSAASLGFVDIYHHTKMPDGWAREGVHSDEVHLTPGVVGEVFMHRRSPKVS